MIPNTEFITTFLNIRDYDFNFFMFGGIWLPPLAERNSSDFAKTSL